MHSKISITCEEDKEKEGFFALWDLNPGDETCSGFFFIIEIPSVIYGPKQNGSPPPAIIPTASTAASTPIRSRLSDRRAVYDIGFVGFFHLIDCQPHHVLM